MIDHLFNFFLYIIRTHYSFHILNVNTNNNKNVHILHMNYGCYLYEVSKKEFDKMIFLKYIY